MQLIQYNVTTYFDNKAIKLPKSDQKASKPLTSVSERLKGKTGRIRGNLMGKRVDFSARTVITSDPNLGLDELGVPVKIAMNVTFPEVVTSYNIDSLTKLVRNGRDIYPGANFVVPYSNIERGINTKIDLRYRKKTVKLHFGDVVERHLIEGDPVLFNRQPTLHKMSMMCHRVKVIKDENICTFRINVNVTAPYNADFDGDEMNMFIPQSIQAQLELANIADVKRQIITPRTSHVLIKFKQDTIIGSFRMTEENIMINFHDAMNIVSCIKNVKPFTLPKRDIGTHELYSLIIPDGLNYKQSSNGKTTFDMNNGKLLTGIVGEQILNKKIVYFSWDRHGPEITKNFYDNAQKLTAKFLLLNGFTVGLGDTMTDKETLIKTNLLSESKMLEVDHLITEIENNPDLLDPQTFEENLQSLLKATDGEITKSIYGSLNSKNNFYVMVAAGAKGSAANIGKIIGGVGQDVLEFKRIRKRVNNRTLPHFFQNDDRALARGFIPNSYLKGLTPQEIFFHHMAGREGLIDTAIKTADSGYLERKLVKGMEDVMVCYDGTVRSGNNVIIQMLYGGNHINQTYYKDVYLNIVNMNNEKIKFTFGLTDDEIKELIKLTKENYNAIKLKNDDHVKNMIIYRDSLRDLQEKGRYNYVTVQDSYQLPCNFSRIIDDTKNMILRGTNPPEVLKYEYILESIEYILYPEVTKIVYMLESEYKKRDTFKYRNQECGKYLFKIALNEYLSPKKCLLNYKFSKQQFDNVCEEIISSFKKSCVQPGDMVGTVTAQTIGEILTQMSIIGHTKILVLSIQKNNNKKILTKTTMSEFIEKLYNDYPNFIKSILHHENSTEYCLAFLENEYYICGVDNDEKVKWNKISHLSRHPTNGNLLKIKTSSGRYVTCTKSHNFLKRTKDNGIIAVTSDELKLKDRIPVARKIKYLTNNKFIIIGDFKFDFTNQMGWLIGAYLAEGTINNYQINISNVSNEYYKNMYNIGELLNIDVKIRNYKGEYGPSTTTSFNHKILANLITDTCGKGSFNKHIPQFAHNSNLDFVKGLLRGYFDGDGNISADRKIIRAGSRSKELIEDITFLLSYLGIFASNYEEIKSNNPTPLYCLGIPHKYAKKFLEEIGTDFESKKKDIESIIEYSESIDPKIAKEFMDMIPELGHIISRVSTILKMPGNSRLYGRYERKDLAIGRETLLRYINKFTDKARELNLYDDVKNDLDYLRLIYEGEVIWDEITEIEEINDPKEYVYDFTVPQNETFMLYNGLIVHNTLNSVTHDEQIYYKNGDNCEIVNIGDMIDELLQNDYQKIIKVNNETKTEYLDISHMNLQVPSVDENGKMHWKLIEAVTRHLPGGNVVRIKTQSGREVVATKAKSFLMRKDNKLVDVAGSDIKIGDRLPVQLKAPKLDKYLEYLDLSKYLSKNEYIYGSEAIKAINFKNNNGIKNWWSNGKNKDFYLPYKRSDIFIDSIKKNKFILNSNIILPLHNSSVKSNLAEMMLLDELCGFFFGAYLAEGCLSRAQVIISNNNEIYRNKIIEFASRYNFKYHVQIQNNKNFEGATSTDIRIHSIMLVDIVLKSCGKYSHDKNIPSWALISNDNFVKGLLDGYFSGDGTVNKRDTYICASSASKKLLIGISELLNRFNIMCKISQHIINNNNIGSKNIKPVNTLSIRNNNVNIFAEKIGLTIEAKQIIAEKSYNKNWKNINGRFDIIPGVNIKNIVGNFSRTYLYNVYNNTNDYEIKKVLFDTLNEDVYYDEIIEIEDLPIEKITPNCDKVYDLTVAETRNFNMFGGLCMRDTFHQTGAGVKGMQGIPRFKELLSYSKNISTPLMVIKLLPEVRNDKKKVHKITSYLKHIQLKDIVQKCEIIYDSNPLDSESFGTHDGIDYSSKFNFTSSNPGLENVPWLFRLTLNRESMLEYDVTLLDIRSKFVKYWMENFNDLTGMKKKSVITKVISGIILSNYDNSPKPIIHIKVELSNPNNSMLIDLQQLILYKISIKGTTDITSIESIDDQQVLDYNDQGDIIINKESILSTSGIDMNIVKNIKGIDFNKTFVNDVHTIYINFGIEAARNLIVKEIDHLYTGSGNAINTTHICLLADVMTNNGNITPINRHGINRLDTDPLSRASFEMTVEQLLTAAAFNEVDHLRSVSSRIMTGMAFNGGTGLCNVFMDNDMLENSELNPRSKSNIENINKLDINPLIDDIIKRDVENIFYIDE